MQRRQQLHPQPPDVQCPPVSQHQSHALTILVGVHVGGGPKAQRHETHAHDSAIVQIPRQLFSFNPRRAEQLEGRPSSPPHRHPARTQQLHRRIKSVFRQAAQIGRGIDPLQPRLVEPLLALPSRQWHHRQARADFLLPVEQPRQLTQRHPVAQRQGKVALKVQPVGVQDRPFDRAPVQWVGTVEHHELDAAPRRLFHRIAHSGDVGVVAHPGVLNIKDECVQPVQHLRRGPPRLAIQTVHSQTGGRVGAIFHAPRSHAFHPMLGRK